MRENQNVVVLAKGFSQRFRQSLTDVASEFLIYVQILLNVGQFTGNNPVAQGRKWK